MTAATEMETESVPAGVELKRVFQAPRERVFEAWTNADALSAELLSVAIRRCP